MSRVRAFSPSEVELAREVVRTRPRPPGERLWADRHPVAARLEHLAPGAALAAELAELEPAEIDTEGLLEGIAAWERVLAWASARQASLAAELERRATGNRVEFVADEVATRLAISRRSAEMLLDRGRALAHLPEVHDALSTGSIDVRKADALLRETRHRTFEDTREILATVLPTAPSSTTPQIRAAVRRAEAALDPTALRTRHEHARRERCVRLTPAPDAMAWVTAFLPATDAVTIMTAVDAMATSTTPDDDRPLDARRADALTAAMRRILDSGTGPDGPLPVRQTRRPHLRLTMSQAAARPGTEGLAELAGYGLVPAAAARAAAVGATIEHLAIDPRTGEVATARPTSALGDGHADTPVPRALAPRSRSRTDTAIGQAEVAADQSDATAGRGAAPGCRPEDTAGRGAAPGCRPVDTVGRGAALGYRPGTRLARLVVDRDVTCTFPGCRIPASRCDLDHIVPFDHTRPAAEQTRAENLQALCRHHHRLKTHGGWTPARDPASGVTTWRAPGGRTYRRPPVPVEPAHTIAPAEGDGPRDPDPP